MLPYKPASVALLVALLASSAYAEDKDATSQPKAAKTEVKEIALTLCPAQVPAAALANPLLPGWLDRTKGNAAPVYLKAIVILGSGEGVRTTDETWQRIVDWLDTPVDELPRNEVRETLGKFRSVLAQVDIAARRSHCHWDMAIREQNENLFGILLPELAELRNIGRLLALQVRLHIAEGDCDAAIRTLQTGYSLARHVGQQPFLVSGLVGISIAGLMNQQIAVLAEAPGSPNLYWSLAALPRPLVDLRRAIDLESVTIYLMSPELNQLRRGKHTDVDWDAMLKRHLSEMGDLVSFMTDGDDTPRQKSTNWEIVSKQVGKARSGLRQRGYSEEEVDEMSIGQAILLHSVLTYDELRDSLFKWFYLPYWQVHEEIAKAEKGLRAECARREIIPVAGMLLPAIGASWRAVARSQREIDLLRIVEAIRLFAATHDGQLPDRLEEIHGVPIPHNPMSGKPFTYQRQGDEAVLEAISPADDRPVRYVMRIAK